jgi:hypothetical protein
MNPDQQPPGWMERLRQRWQLKSLTQLVLVLIVFACTGFSVLFIKRPILGLISDEARDRIWFTLMYLILIFPVYNLILLFYGFLFGQFRFFWDFEKKFFTRIISKFRKTN